MNFKKRYLPLIFAITILVLLFILLRPSKEEKITDISTIELTLLNGGKLPISDFEGNFFCIHVFSTWCSICKRDLTFINYLQNNYNIPVIGMAVRDNLRKLKILETNKLPYNYIAFENNEETLKKMDISVLPETFIVNDKGEIILHLKGGISRDRFHSKISPILKVLK